VPLTSPVLDLSRVFAMNESDSPAAYRGSFEDADVPYEELHLGTYRPVRPLVVRHEMGGSRPQDAVGMSSAHPLVVSQRLVDALSSHGFEGWTALPVELHDRAGALVPGYHVLGITGRCGPPRRWRSLSLRGFLKTGAIGYGLHIDPSSWDGSHLFTPVGTTFTLVTEPVKRVLNAARLSNLQFEPISEVEVPLV
jgi:hypothetical protein